MYIYMYIYMYIHTYICIYTCVYMYFCLHTHIFIHMSHVFNARVGLRPELVVVMCPASVASSQGAWSGLQIRVWAHRIPD